MVQRPQDLKSSLDDKKHARESGSHAPLSPHSSFSSSSEGPPSLHRIASDRFGNRVPTPKDLYFRRHSHAVDSHQASHYSARDPPVCKRPQTVEEVIFSPLKELGDLSQGSPPSDDDSYRDPATGSLTAAWPYSKHSSLPSRSVQKRHEVKSPSHTPTSHSLASRSSSLPTSTREDLSSQNAETDPATHRTLRSEILHQRINALYYSLKNKHYDVKQRDKEIRELREEVQCLRRELARDKTQKRQRIEKRSSKSNIKVPATPASSSFSSFRPSLETTEVLCERGGKYVEEVPDAGFVVSDSSKRLKRKTQKREEHGPDGPRPHPLSPKTRSRKRSSLMRRGSPSRKENLHQDRDANKKRSETDLLYSSRMHCTRVHSVDKRKIPVEGEVHESCRNQRDVTYNAPRTTSKDAMRNVSSTEKKEAEERAPNPYSASTRIPCQQRGASNTREGSYRTSGRFHTEANGRQLEQGSMHDYYLTKDSREGEGSKKKQASEELPFIRYTAEGDGVSHSREKQSVTRKLSAERKVSSAARSMGKESHLFCSSMHEESVHSRMKQLEEEKRNLEEEATLWKETLHEALHLFVAHAPALQPYVENVLWSTIPSDIKDTKEEGGNAFSLKSIFLPEQPLHQEVRISMPANVARKEKKNRCFSHGSPEIKGSGGKSGRKEESVKNASLPCTGVESGVCGGGMTTVEDTKNIWLSGKWISHIPDAYCSSSAPVSACLEDLASCSPSPVSVQHRKRNAPAMQPSITRVTTTTKTRGESNNDVQRLRDTQRDYWIPLEVFKISQAFRDRCCPSVPITEFYAFMQQLNVIWRNRVEARMTVMKRKLEATSKKKLEALMQMEKQTAVAFAQQASKRHEEECQRWKMKLKELENAFRRLSQSGTASRFSPCDTSPSCCSADFTRPVSKRAATFSAKDAPPLPPSLPMSASLSTSVVRAARERSLKRCVEPQQHLRYCAPFSPEQENEKGGGVEAEIAGKRGSKVVQSSNVRRQPKDGVEQRMKKERTSDCTSSSGSRSRSFNEIHTNRNSIKLETAVSSMGKKLFFLNQVERRLSALRGNIFRKKRSTSSLRLLYQYDDTANTLLHTLRWNSHQGNSTCLLPPPPWSSSSSGEPHSTPRRKGRFHTGNGAVSMSLMECEIKRTSSNDRRYSKKKESRVGTTSHRRADSLSSVSSGLSSSSSSVSRHSYSPIPSSSKVRKCDAKSENQNVDALHKEAHSYYRPFPKRKQKRRKGMAEKLEKQEGSYTGQRRRLLWPLSKSESSDSERSSSSRTRSGGKKSSFRSPSYQRGKNRNSSIRVGTKEFSGHSASINGRFISPSLPSNHQGMNPNDNQPQHQTHSSAKSRPKGCSDEGQNVPQQTPECVASLSSLMASSSKSSHSLHIASIDRPLREVNPNLERLLCLVQHSCEQVQAWSSHMDLATSAATRDLVNFLTPIRSLVTKNNEENRTPVQQGVDVGKTQSPGKREISSIAEGREGNYTPPKSQSSPPIFFSTPTLHTANDSSVLTSDISALSSHRSFSLSSAACHEVLLRVIDSVLDFSEELLNTIQKASQEIHALTNTAMSEAESSMKTKAHIILHWRLSSVAKPTPLCLGKFLISLRLGLRLLLPFRPPMNGNIRALFGPQGKDDLGEKEVRVPRDTSETIQVSSLALLKMLLHGRAGVPLEVMGLMIGDIIDEYTIRVTDVFSMPQTTTGQSVEAVDPEYQVRMLEKLKQVGRHENVVGWYHSHPGFGCWLSSDDVATARGYEQLTARSVSVVIDPIQSVPGHVVIDAFRTMPMMPQAWGGAGRPQVAIPEARQTTSNIGFMCKPSYIALSRGLNQQYYNMPITFRKKNHELSLLMNVYKKGWQEGLKLEDVYQHERDTRNSIREIINFTKQAEKVITQGLDEDDLMNIGKPNAVAHLQREANTVIERNLHQSIGAMINSTAEHHVAGREWQILTFFISFNSFLYMLNKQGVAHNRLSLRFLLYVGEIISLLYQVGVGVLYGAFIFYNGKVEARTALYIGGASMYSFIHLFQLLFHGIPVIGNTKMLGTSTATSETRRLPDFDKSSLLRRITFSWINPVFQEADALTLLLSATKGKQSPPGILHKKHRFDEMLSKLPPLAKKFNCENEILNPLRTAWRGYGTGALASDPRSVAAPRTEVQTHKRLWRLFRVLSQLDGGKEYLWVCIPLKIGQDLLYIASHTTIHSVMLFLESRAEYSTVSAALLAGVYLCVLNIGIRLAQAVMFQFYLYHLYSSSLKVTIALKTLILNSVLETPLGSANATPAASSSMKTKDTAKGGSNVKGGAKKEDKSSGGVFEALSLLTIDADRIGESMIFLHNVWSHPIVIFLALVNMYRTVGLIPTLVAFTSLLLAIPLNKKSSQIVKYAKKNARDVVLRLSDLMVALPMMRSVHAMSLQAAFRSRMHHWRSEESRGAHAIINAEAEATMITDVILIGIYIVTYASYFLFGSNPTMAVSSLLPVAASLSIVRFPIWASPNLVTQVVNGYDAIARIESFVTRCSPTCHNDMADSFHHTRKHISKPGSIKCDGMDFYWSRSNVQSLVANHIPKHVVASASLAAESHEGVSRVISNLQLDIHPGDYVVIKGETGAGKTALLLALLGELYAVPCEEAVNHDKSSARQSNADYLSSTFSHQRWCEGTVAYCAEVPWIADGTVRGNILMRSSNPSSSSSAGKSDNEDKKEELAVTIDEFASADEEAWYRTVFHACELDLDAEEMENSDLSEVGTAGSRLSGGQKARVALARALCYRMGKSDIFILDNVLSALDFDLQQRIIQNVFHELILRKGKTLLLASSVCPPNLLVNAKIVEVQPGGKVKFYSSSTSTPSDSASSSVLSSFKIPCISHSSSEVIKSSTVKDGAGLTDQKKKQSLISSGAASTATFSLLPRWKELRTLLWDHFGHSTALLVLFLFVLRQVIFSLADNWMGLWFVFQNRASCLSDPEAEWSWASVFRDAGGCTAVTTFIVTYALIGALACAMSYFGTTYFFLSFQKAADRLHMSVVNTILDAPASFFDDSTAVDHVLQVLTKDQRVVDQMVAESVRLIITSILQVFTVIAVNMFQYPLFVVVIPIIIPVFYRLNAHFLRLSKPLRVLESNEKEKATMTLKNAVSGAVTLRAFGSEAMAAASKDWCNAVDAATRVSHIALTNDRWVALRLEFLSLFMLALYQVFVVCAVLRYVAHRSARSTLETTSAGGSSALAGLGALALMNSTQQLGQLCRRLGMFQSQFVSVERFIELERDATAVTPKFSSPLISPMSRGSAIANNSDAVLTVSNLTCRYQQHLPRVLSSFSFSVRSGECLGIIGRSGSGKSSVFNALLRVMDVVEGTVSLRSRTEKTEVVDALSIPLYDLRRKYLHLVPQEPLIVEGTIRENLLLGAMENFPDKELMDILLVVGVAEKLEPGRGSDDPSILDIHLTGGGKNLSAGQRQLLSIARALLHKPSVLLLDEVTSRIDEESERLLVNVIRVKLQCGCSVILISHRRETVEALCQKALFVRSGTIVGEVSQSEIEKAFDVFESAPENFDIDLKVNKTFS